LYLYFVLGSILFSGAVGEWDAGCLMAPGDIGRTQILDYKVLNIFNDSK